MKTTKPEVAGPRTTRRNFIAGAGAVTGAAAIGLGAPVVLAQTAPLRIGLLQPFSKNYAVLGNSIANGLSLYFEEQKWEVAGRKIEVIREDDELSPQVGLQKARKLLQNDKVDFIVGPQVQNVAFAILELVKQSRSMLLVTTGGTAMTWERIPSMFRVSLSGWQMYHPMGEWLAKNVGKEIVCTSSDSSAGRTDLPIFEKSFTEAGGKVLKQIFPPLGTNDFSAYLSELRSLKAPATYNFYAGSDAVRFVNQYAEFGVNKISKLTGPGFLLESDVLSGAGKAALGGLTILHYAETLDFPENRSFVAAHRARFNEFPSVYSEYGFVAARIIAETLKAVQGDISAQDRVIEAMTAVKFNAPRGPFRFDPVTHNPVHNMYIREVVEIDGRVTNKVIGTIEGVKDPGIKTF
jgi:branched-chain amino acid transport system substrate-binding protein